MGPPIDSVVAMIFGSCGYFYLLYHILVINDHSCSKKEIILILCPGIITLFGILIHLLIGLDRVLDHIIFIRDSIVDGICYIWPEKLKVKMRGYNPDLDIFRDIENYKSKAKEN